MFILKKNTYIRKQHTHTHHTHTPRTHIHTPHTHTHTTHRHTHTHINVYVLTIYDKCYTSQQSSTRSPWHYVTLPNKALLAVPDTTLSSPTKLYSQSLTLRYAPQQSSTRSPWRFTNINFVITDILKWRGSNSALFCSVRNFKPTSVSKLWYLSPETFCSPFPLLNYFFFALESKTRTFFFFNSSLQRNSYWDESWWNESKSPNVITIVFAVLIKV